MLEAKRSNISQTEIKEKKNKLRVGILLDDYLIPAWSYKMLEEINASASSEIVLIVKNKSETVDKKSLINRLIAKRSHILYELFNKIDAYLFKITPDAFELKDVRALSPFNSIEVTPAKAEFTDSFNEFDLKEIKKCNIDIFFKTGFRTLNGDILKLAKYGVWSFRHADHRINNVRASGFWEVVENRAETGVILQILTENPDRGILLYKSYSLTDPTSPTRNKNIYYWKALSFLPSKIEELYNIGEEAFFKKVEAINGHPQFYSNKLYTTPSNKEMLSLGLKLLLKYFSNKIFSLFYLEQWILLFNLSGDKSISTTFFNYKKIIPPKDRFWADPFIVHKNDKYYIFIEELLFSKDKGHISLIVMDEKGNYTSPTKVLEKDYHLSYPFLIEENGELYMLPETAKNETIELYRCTGFPLKWELEMVLIENITALDSTIIFKNGKYWLFANVIKNKGASSLDELFLFYSDKLISNSWTPHPQNPIISDVKQSRPAGKLFIYKDKLYRPSQNCSIRYGYGMKINQVIELTETSYQEKVVDSILPDWDKKIKATHTINSVDNLTVIDALMIRRK